VGVLTSLDVPTVRVVPVWGPSIDGPVSLGPGRHVIGRGAGLAVCVDDPLVEVHHLLLGIDRDGTSWVVQLAGRIPALVDGEPVDGPTPIVPGSTIDLGATRLRVVAWSEGPLPVHTGEVPGDPASRMVLRPPRTLGVLTTPAIEVPCTESPERERSTGMTGLVAPVAALVGAVVMAVLVGQPMFALFGAVGAGVSILTWAVGAVRNGRRSRASRRRFRDDVERFEAEIATARKRIIDHHLAVTPTVERALAAVGSVDLWQRRADHGDAFVVSVGFGAVCRPIPLSVDRRETAMFEPAPELLALAERAARIEDAPLDVALDGRDQQVVAIVGTGRAAVVRGLVVQLAVQTGPADVRMVAISDRPEQYAWLDFFPHARHDEVTAVIDPSDAAGFATALRQLDDGDPRRLVVLVDQPTLLAARSAPLRRLLEGDRLVTVLVEVPTAAEVPTVCRASLRIGVHGLAQWCHDHDPATGASPWANRVRVVGVSRRVTERLGRSLAQLIDPEVETAGARRLPTDLALTDVCGDVGTGDGVLAAWQSLGDGTHLTAPIGCTDHGVLEIDLVGDGPHALIAGTTGSGKSELLRTLVVSLAARVGPDHVNFVLVDYKGGATFDSCVDLPHTVGLVTDLDEGAASRALVSLEAELRRREGILRRHGVSDLPALRATPGAGPLPRLVVVIDEFAALASELPDFLASLVGVAQRGRSLGIHLVLATQRPAGVVDDAIRANTDLRIALRLNDVADALDVVGDASPASFGRGVPGRAVLRSGPGDLVQFQSARCTLPTGRAAGCSTELEALVSAIRSAFDRSGLEPPHRPWLPALPSELSEPLPSDAVGLVDDPARQRRTPLVWRRSGNLALVGALGTGTTTALVTLAAQLARQDVRAHLYVVDARGDAALEALASLDDCAGVVRLHERERLHRTLHALTGEIDRRRASGARDRTSTGLSDVVLFIDGLGVLRRALDEPGSADLLAGLDRVLAEGPDVGVVTAAAVEADGVAASVMARFSERWVFHLDDASVGPLVGVPSGRVPPAVPGRVVVASTGLDAQLGRSTVTTTRAARRGQGPSPIEVLPAHVDLHDVVPTSSPGNERSTSIPLGLRFDDLQPAHLELSPGDHVMVLGPPRSGRTWALSLLMEAWNVSHPEGSVSVLCGSARSELDGHRDRVESVDVLVDALTGRVAGGQPCLVVVDDAERVIDPGRRLATFIEEHAGLVSVFAAARPEQLRAVYGHWTEAVRRGRLGLVMTASGDGAGDLVGAVLPRRSPLPPRPGLAWLVDGSEAVLVQLAAGVSPRHGARAASTVRRTSTSCPAVPGSAA
jgi:DNA segregation ATPase FtsK/SpoIIIE, S-DNA-T family